MSRIRVYELAREMKLESKLLVSKLKDLGISVASHQSTLSPDQVLKVKRGLQENVDAEKTVKGSASPVIIRRKRKVDEAALRSGRPRRIPSASSSEVEGKSEVAKKPEEGGRSASQDVTADRAPVQKEEITSKEVNQEAKAKALDDSAKEVASLTRSEADESLISKGEPDALPKSEPLATDKEPASSGAASVKQGEVEAKRSEAEQEIKKVGDEIPSKAVSDIKPTEEGQLTTVKEVALDAKIRPVTEAKREKVVKTPKPVGVDKQAERGVSKGSKSSATIVRRATPQEVEARKAAVGGSKESEGKKAYQRDHRAGKEKTSELSKGKAALKNKQPAQESFPIEGTPSKEGGRSKAFQGEKRKSSFKTGRVEEEPARKHVPKSKRDHVNTRVLLSEVDTFVEDEFGVQKKKTVYTPAASNRKRDYKRRKDLKKTKITTPRATYRVIKMGSTIAVSELGKGLGIKAGELIKKLMSQGVMATINQEIDFDIASLIAGEYNYEVRSNIVTEEDILEKTRSSQGVEQSERPPIVTVMGHVDHGKTSILDAVKQSKVVESEAGGITQHIGAYWVEFSDKLITFLDTPGHEAFSAMRARGAKVTDIVVLVVAADDGVKPQTVEAISHARDAGVPIIVAINKIDKPNINRDRIYTELMEHGIQSEEWGGEHQFVEVSAKEKIGLDDLLEAILLQAEMLELKAADAIAAEGSVVEAHLDKGRGPVATVIVQNGTLKVGDVVVVGTVTGKVRAMNDHLGQQLTEAKPSMPVEIIGLTEVPMAGDSVVVTENDKVAKEIVQWRLDSSRGKGELKSSAATLEQLLGKVQDNQVPEVPVIIKGDTQGSIEAIADAILKIKSDKVKNRIVHKAVGGITESDISLAEASEAVIVAFNVRAGRGLNEQAEMKGIPIKYFSVIYEVVDALKAIMAGTLPPIAKEVVQGHAEVRATIKVPKVGIVAGTAILDGKVTRNSRLRLIRDDVVIYSGKLGSLRRFKDDVKEVSQGYECGIGIEGYDDIHEGDIIESFVIEEETATI